MQPILDTQANLTMQPTSQRWLYLGTLRQESLDALLAHQELPEQAEFITPETPEDAWREIIKVLPQAQQRTTKLAQHAGEQPYYRYNLSEFNATQRATGLHSLYPGLVLEDDSPVRLEPLQSLIAEIAEHPVQTLVIEQPELVLPLLEGLAQAHALPSLRNLWLRTGLESPYENTPSQAELLGWCEQQGFEITQRLADDPDFSLLQLRRHPLFDAWQSEQARNAELTQECDALKDERKNLRKQAEEQATVLEKLRAQSAEQASTNDTLTQGNDALSEEVAQLKKRRSELKQQGEKQRKALEQQLIEAQELIEIQQAKVEKLHEEKQASESTLKQREQELGDEISHLKKRRDQLKQEAETLNKSLDEEKKRCQELKEQLNEQEQAAAQPEDKHEALLAESKKLEKRAADRQQQVNELQKRNQILQGENERLSQRQSQLESELLKAEAQIDVIKDLMLND